MVRSVIRLINYALVGLFCYVVSFDCFFFSICLLLGQHSNLRKKNELEMKIKWKTYAAKRKYAKEKKNRLNSKGRESSW